MLSDDFLMRVAALEQKNLALETLRKLLNDQIRSTERTNLVQSKRFREVHEDAMTRYTNKAITTAEMIARLIDLAKHLREVHQQGKELGLSHPAFEDRFARRSWRALRSSRLEEEALSRNPLRRHFDGRVGTQPCDSQLIKSERVDLNQRRVLFKK